MNGEQRELEILHRAQELAFVFAAGKHEDVADQLLEIVNRRNAMALCAFLMLALDDASRDALGKILLRRVGREQ
jgi:hypothetical protein